MSCMLRIKLTPINELFWHSNNNINFVKIRCVSWQASACAAEWVGGIFCLPDAAWMELIPLERGKVRTGAGRERFPLSHENSIAVPAARLFRSLPPNQTVLMTHDPRTGTLGAGQRLSSVILRPQHRPLYCPSLLPFTLIPLSTVNPRCSPVRLPLQFSGS